MPLEPFTMFFVLRFDEAWPRSEPLLLVARRTPGGAWFTLGRAEDGCLYVTLATTDQEPAIVTVFERVEAPPPATLVVTVIYSPEHGTRLTINFRDLRPVAEAGDDPPVVIEPAARADGIRALDVEDAGEVCQAAMQSRAMWWQRRKPFKDARPTRPKTIDEQCDNLARAVSALRRRVEGIHKGNLEDLTDLAAQLRGLLSRPNDGPTWNPLLIRLAVAFDRPLPVFWIPEPDEPFPVTGWSKRIGGSSLSLTRETPNHSLGDLEEYLSLEVISVQRTDGSTETAAGADLLLKLASSDAAGHYDDTIALILDDSRDGLPGLDFLTAFIVSLALVTAELGDDLLRGQRP